MIFDIAHMFVHAWVCNDCVHVCMYYVFMHLYDMICMRGKAVPRRRMSTLLRASHSRNFHQTYIDAYSK